MSTTLPSEAEYNLLWRHFEQGYSALDSRYEAGRIRGGPAIATTDGAGRRVELVLLRPVRGVSRGSVLVDGKAAGEIDSPDQLSDPVLRSVVATLAERLRAEAERVVQEREAERLRRREELQQRQADAARQQGEAAPPATNDGKPADPAG